MAGSKSDFLEDEINDHVLGNAAYTAPANTFIALFTAAPTDAGGGTEATGGSYARLSITNNATNWPASSAGLKSNGTDFTFVEATASWGTIVAMGIFDAISAGNLLYWGDLTTNKSIDNGDTARFATGDIDIQED